MLRTLVPALIPEELDLERLDDDHGVAVLEHSADGRECKMVTGVDDHCRLVVIASVMAMPSTRAVRSAFTAAMRRYGVTPSRWRWCSSTFGRSVVAPCRPPCRRHGNSCPAAAK